MVTTYIALTEFARDKFIEGGLPADRIVVKPNFVQPDPGPGSGSGDALFVGRLTAEKGVLTLLDAWRRLGGKARLRIVGDGPLAPKVVNASKSIEGVDYLGWKSRGDVIQLMQNSAFLVFPSEWYEGFPMTIAEAFATGLPVIGSKLGAMVSVVDDGRTGMHFEPGDPQDLADKVEWLVSHPTELARMRQEARAEFEAKYTAERNYEMLMNVYETAVERAGRRSS